MIKPIRWLGGLVLLMMCTVTAHASVGLTAITGGPNGDRMVNDSVLDVTWADVASPPVNFYMPDNCCGITYAGSAQEWIAGLNSTNYGGHNDWRLATDNGNLDDHYCVPGSLDELGCLFYNELGAPLWIPVTNFGPFTSLLAYKYYWSGTRSQFLAWRFYTGDAGQYGAYDGNISVFRVLAVRSGQSPAGVTIGGNISGLTAGQSVTLLNNGGDAISLSANGAFTFPTALSSGASYQVSIGTQPLDETCFIANAIGSVTTANITNVTVTCIPNAYFIGGTVTGLGSGKSLTLQNNGGDAVTVSSDSDFYFPTDLPSGTGYSVSIATQPAGQLCTVSNGTGVVSGATISNVIIACNNLYTIGGTLSGLAPGKSVILSNNGTDTLILSANSGFSFSSPLPAGTGYSVNVIIQPAGQTCLVANGAGSVSGTVSNVSVLCSSTYTVSGVISGLTATGLVLRLNGTSLIIANSASKFKFATALTDNSPYSVSVGIQPVGMSCVVSNGIGIITAANVTNVTIACNKTYTVSGSISGLTASGLILKLNGGANKIVPSGSSAFSFATALITGTPYAVTIQQQPTGLTCSLANDTGTIGTGNITNVTVSCSINTYSIGGVVSGLGIGKSIVLKNNGGYSLLVTANGSFTFTTQLPSGTSYFVTTGTIPSGQSCFVFNGSGTVATSNVTNVTVACTTYTVGGSISGLTSSGLVLQLNGAENLTVASGATAFGFSSSLVYGQSYTVTVGTQPIGMTCNVSNGSGVILGADVTNIVVSCSRNYYTIGGTVSGLNGSVILLNNGGDALMLGLSGAFTFPTPVISRNTYSVTVGTQPAGYTCLVSNGTGTIIGSNITNVSINCSPNLFTVSVSNPANASVSITGTTQVNAPSTASSILFNDTYGDANVTVSASKAGNTCTLSGTTIPNYITGNVTGVIVNCVPITYTISGSNNSSATLAASGSTAATGNVITGTTSFSFSARYGDTVQLIANKSHNTCTVSGLPTTINNDVIGVTVSCVLNANVSISGIASGHSETNGILSLTLTDTTTSEVIGTVSNIVSGTAPFSFPNSVPQGGSWLVSVDSQPQDETCLTLNASGVNAIIDVANVEVVCSVNKYTIGGAISGLSYTAGTFVVQVSDGATVPTIQTVTIPSGATSYTITPGLVHATNYTVTVQTQPNGQTCTLANSVGATGSSNVTNVDIACVAATYTVGFTVTGFVAVSSPVTATSSTTNAVFTTNLPANGSRISFSNTGGGLTAAVNYYVFNATAATAPASGGTFQVSLTAGSTTPVTLTTATTFAPAVTGTATQLVVQNNLVDDFTVTANTGGTATNTFATATGLSTGTAYAVTVKSSSQHQTCTTGGTAAGTITNANIVVPVTCVSNEVQVSGNISGHSIGMGAGAAGAVLSLKVNGSSTANETLPALADIASTFAFGTYVPVGQTYAVSIDSQPSIGTATTGVPNVRNCTMYNGSGTTVGQPANNTIITCRSTDKTKLGMWVVNPTSNTMNQYTMDATGKPVLNSTPILGSLNTGTPVFKTPTAVATTALNTAVLVANAGDNTLYSYQVGAGMGVGTALTATTSAPVSTGSNPYAIAVSPTSAMTAFVTNTGGNSVSGYTISGGATPAVTALAVIGTSVNPTPVGISPRGLAFHPSGRWLYVVNGGSNTVQAFNVTGGGLTALNTLGTNPGTNTVATGSDPYYIAFDPSGKYAYVTNGGDHTISQYKVCQYTDLTCTQGTLSANGSPVAVGSVSPRGISVDDGNVYVVSKDGKTVSQFTIGSNGQLSATPTSTIATGNGASNIAINPAFTSGATPVVYVTNSTDDTLQSITATAPNPLAALDSQSTLTGTITANGSTQIGISQ